MLFFNGERNLTSFSMNKNQYLSTVHIFFFWTIEYFVQLCLCSAVFFDQHWARIATNQVAASRNGSIEIKCASVHQVACTILQGAGEKQEGPLCNSMDCSPPVSSVHRISQARIPEYLAISFSKGSSWPRDWTYVPYASFIGRWVLYH